MTRIFIIDESEYVCQLTAETLSQEPGIEIVDCATSAKQAVPMLVDKAQDGDIVLLSASISPSKGIEILRICEEGDKKVKVLVTGLPESDQEILRYLEAGAEGYVLRRKSTQELHQNIKKLSQDEFNLEPRLASILIDRVAKLARLCLELDEGDHEGYQQLTNREREVLALVEMGHTNAEIAEALGVELGTIKNHVHNILSKLDVDRREDAAVIYRRHITLTRSLESPD